MTREIDKNELFIIKKMIEGGSSAIKRLPNIKTVEAQMTIAKKNLEEDSGYILMSNSVFRISKKDCSLY